jgi:hypothetical protein
MSQREIKAFDPKWVIVGLAGAIAIVLGVFGSQILDIDLSRRIVSEIDSTPFSTDLAQGPVAGMPRSTFDALTASPEIVTGLQSGPVAGMPRSTFEALTASPEIVTGLQSGPVAGMPRSTFEQLLEATD